MPFDLPALDAFIAAMRIEECVHEIRQTLVRVHAGGAFPDFELLTEHGGPIPSAHFYLRRHDVAELADGRRVAVHEFFQPDPDKDPHDHPWDLASLILRGGYVQEDEEGRRELGPGDLNVRAAHRPHKVVELLAVPTRTLIVMGPRRREWGFTTPFGWVPFKRYPRATVANFSGRRR